MEIKAIVRLLVTVILTINACLTAKGMNPIPFDESAFTEAVTYILSAVTIVWSWWKNNNVTKAACEAQGYLDQLKGKTQNNVDVELMEGDK